MSPEANFNKEYKKALEINELTFEVPKHVKDLMIIGLSKSSPMKLGLKGSQVKELMTKEKLSFYDYACLSNNLESFSAHDLDMPFEAYLNTMIEVEELSLIWNKETEDMRQVILQNIAKKNLKPNGLKSV